MKRKVLFILIIIIEMIIVSFFSATKAFWGILILNIIITAGVIFIGKKTRNTMKNDYRKIAIFLIIFILLKIIVIIHETIYTQGLVDDVINMYSSSFLKNINSYDELYEALNVSDEDKRILANGEDAVEVWIDSKNSNPINYIIYCSPLIERFEVESSRILWLSGISISEKLRKFI